MNPLGINLWNWCPGLSGGPAWGCLEKAARMGFTALELPMTQPELPAGLGTRSGIRGWQCPCARPWPRAGPVEFVPRCGRGP